MKCTLSCCMPVKPLIRFSACSLASATLAQLPTHEQLKYPPSLTPALLYADFTWIIIKYIWRNLIFHMQRIINREMDSFFTHLSFSVPKMDAKYSAIFPSSGHLCSSSSNYAPVVTQYWVFELIPRLARPIFSLPLFRQSPPPALYWIHFHRRQWTDQSERCMWVRTSSGISIQIRVSEKLISLPTLILTKPASCLACIG